MDDFPEYYPAEPFTVVVDSGADKETGHEFVLHFDPEEERYHVFFFETFGYADKLRDEYERTSGRDALVVRFEPRAIEDHVGVRYVNRDGARTDMTIGEYRKNMELRNPYRRDD
ncbi:MAG: hypothetical protein H7Y38_20015 [Armatimonadetes bacterium]|nr:hypothetical protein [Armatimonadota bacterium]